MCWDAQGIATYYCYLSVSLVAKVHVVDLNFLPLVMNDLGTNEKAHAEIPWCFAFSFQFDVKKCINYTPNYFKKWLLRLQC